MFRTRIPFTKVCRSKFHSLFHSSQKSPAHKRKSHRLVHLIWLAGKRNDRVLFSKYLPLAQMQLLSQKDPPSQLTLKMYLFSLRSFTEKNFSTEISWTVAEKVVLNKITNHSADLEESDYLLVASTFSKAEAGSEALWTRLVVYFDHLIFREQKEFNLDELMSLLCSFVKASGRLPFLKTEKFLSNLLSSKIKNKINSFSNDSLIEVLNASVRMKDEQGTIEIALQALKCLKLKENNMNTKHYAVAIWSAAKLGIRNNPIQIPREFNTILQQTNSTEYIMILWGLVKSDKMTPDVNSFLMNLFLKKNYNFKFDGLSIIGWCFAKLLLKDEAVWEKYYKISQNALRLRKNYPLRDYANFAWTLKMNQRNNMKPKGVIYNLLEEKLMAALETCKCDLFDHGALSGLAVVLSRADRGSAQLWKKMSDAFKIIYRNPEFIKRACDKYELFGVFIGNLSCFSEVFPADEELWKGVDIILEKTLIMFGASLTHRDLSNIVRSLGGRRKVGQCLLETIEKLVLEKLKQNNMKNAIKGIDLFNYIFFSKRLGWKKETYKVLKEFSSVLEKDLDRKKKEECFEIFKRQNI